MQCWPVVHIDYRTYKHFCHSTYYSLYYGTVLSTMSILHFIVCTLVHICTIVQYSTRTIIHVLCKVLYTLIHVNVYSAIRLLVRSTTVIHLLYSKSIVQMYRTCTIVRSTFPSMYYSPQNKIAFCTIVHSQKIIREQVKYKKHKNRYSHYLFQDLNLAESLPFYNLSSIKHIAFLNSHMLLKLLPY